MASFNGLAVIEHEYYHAIIATPLSRHRRRPGLMAVITPPRHFATPPYCAVNGDIRHHQSRLPPSSIINNTSQWR